VKKFKIQPLKLFSLPLSPLVEVSTACFSLIFKILIFLSLSLGSQLLKNHTDWILTREIRIATCWESRWLSINFESLCISANSSLKRFPVSSWTWRLAQTIIGLEHVHWKRFMINSSYLRRLFVFSGLSLTAHGFVSCLPSRPLSLYV
jgi:hypothetical protein